MRLTVKPVSKLDLEAAKAIYGKDRGDLSAAACTICFPIAADDLAAHKRRAEWSMQQQIDLLERDPTIRFMRVIDEDAGGETVAYGRWHYYPNGYVDMGDLEVSGATPRNEAAWPEGLAKDLYCGVLDAALNARTEWMKPQEGPYWVLTNLATREPLQKNGAGSLLLKWGLEQANRDGVPAYLEAAPDAKGLYEKHGFKTVGKTKFKDGDVEIEFCNMRADP